ncbi:DUF63 family protein [Halorussus halophilus]|uniref:DUF63 family protein n=1 Tax=Halorussus halophilus TaxID=2650975 RepID=UPI0013014485|nr:DUF63 family protein [Halorussus halophilus]
MILPEGFALPPLQYLVPLLAAVALVGWSLARSDPTVSDRTVLALAPWVLVGSSLHVLYVVEWVPESVAPLLGTPSVYLTTFVAAGLVWLAALKSDSPVEHRLAVSGLTVGVPIVGYALARGDSTGTGLQLFWPSVGLVAAIILTALAWAATRQQFPDVAAATGAVGALALFGHALDAASTAVGVDALGFDERTPLSAAILEIAADLPTADVLGTGWLFVLVKLAIAELVVVLFADFVREDPTEGYLLLGAVAAVGLGPGAHNLLLFAIAG